MRLEYICIFRLATGAEALSAWSNESSLSLHFIAYDGICSCLSGTWNHLFHFMHLCNYAVTNFGAWTFTAPRRESLFLALVVTTLSKESLFLKLK